MVGFVVVGLDGSGVNLGQGTGVGTGRKWGLTGDGRGGQVRPRMLFCVIFRTRTLVSLFFKQLFRSLRASGGTPPYYTQF